MASIDDRYRLRSVVHHCDGRYSVAEHDLGAYLVPKKPVEVTADLLHRTQRGIAYTASPFAYVFERSGSGEVSVEIDNGVFVFDGTISVD